MDKLTLAHDYFMKHVNSNEYGRVDDDELIIWSWQYADSMFAEFEKRQDKTLPDAIWQPDWSLAPDDAVACAMDEDGWVWWYRDIPEKSYIKWNGDDICFYPNHNYTGDWRNSLRIRPSSK